LNKGYTFVVGNFTRMPPEYLCLLKNESYIIYEHDHKYVTTRDPSVFKDFCIPRHSIANYNFYHRAKAVVVLSEICKKIIIENLGLNNVYNIGTSLWSEAHLNKIESLLGTEKTIECGILDSANPIKGSSSAAQYCKSRNITPTKIGSNNPTVFLEQLSKCKTLVYLPQVLETFNRLTAEARMLNCNLITRRAKLGFASESCFELKGKKLIDEIRQRVQSALVLFDKLVESCLTQDDRPTIAFVGKFEKLYDEEGKAQALESAGFRVWRYDELWFSKNPTLASELLLARKPDIVMYTKLRIPKAEKLIERSKEQEAKTVCWVPDLYFGLPREEELYAKAPVFTSDYVFTPDGGHDKEFEALGINHICVKQGISEKYLSPISLQQKKDIDILFVGTLGPEHGASRHKLLSFLRKRYLDRFVWIGQRGPHSCRDEELVKTYQRAKIVIGDCVESDNYWSNRIYETLGRSAFLLHPDVPGLETQFVNEKHLVLFERGNYDELEEKIEYYLANDSIREEIAHNGYLEVAQNHTLLDRARQVLEILK